MRKWATPQERRVWQWLRDRRFGGFKWRRQHPIGTYIVDFYCVELNLAIELDGAHHEAIWMANYENGRTTALNRLGIELLRIPNALLKQDFELVAESIRWAIERRALTRRFAPPSPA